MVIWRSLSPSVLARVLEFALAQARPVLRQRGAEDAKTLPLTADEQKTSPQT